jgi:Family of unknown function (DUF6545)
MPDATHVLNVVNPLVATAMWTFTAKQARVVRHSPRNRGAVLLCGVLVAGSGVWTLNPPFVYTFVDRVTGVANLAILLIYCCAIAAFGLEQVLFAFWVYPAEEARLRTLPRVVAPVLALVGMAAAFFHAPLEVYGERPVNFEGPYAVFGNAAVFSTIYWAVLLVCYVDAGRLQWRYSALVGGDPWLRRGLRFACGSAVFGVTCCTVKLSTVGGRWWGWFDYGPAVDFWNIDVAYGAAVMSAVCMMVGWTLPAWGHRLSRCATWLRRYIAYQRLYPLWKVLHAGTPAIALQPPRSRWSVRDLGFRLLRLIIEIRDGQFALRPWMDPAAAEYAHRHGRAAGYTGDQLLALVEAATITAALHAKKLDRPERVGGTGNPALGGDDEATETAWLTRVAQALRDPVAAVSRQ